MTLLQKSTLFLLVVGCSPLTREEEVLVVPTTAEERTAELTSQSKRPLTVSCADHATSEPPEPFEPHLSFEEASRLFEQNLLKANLEDDMLESEWAGTALKTARKRSAKHQEDEVLQASTLRLVRARR
jgi:hypothetical protein